MTSSASTESSARVTSAPPLGPEHRVAWPARSARTFPNGLEVVLAESHTFPKIEAELFFRSGNAATALQSPGLAEMTASVVRTGTLHRTRRAIEEDLRSMGANLGTTAGADTSAISISGLAEFAKGLLELVSDLARDASFPDDEFERIRRQKIEELRIERTTPGFLASERLRRTLFGAHPYAIIAPTEAQVESYRRENLQAYYRQHYTPANALLIVVGDFKTAEMFALIEEIFAGWSGLAPKKNIRRGASGLSRASRATHSFARLGSNGCADRQSRDHAAPSGLVSACAREFNFRRGVQFTARDEHP
jgi:zinc protease